ncbi:aconitate hydratase [Chitinivibrio alkaliphilus]|uniref:Aconitate hydratase A n=1 Tax=Chitinivibrio alkaliphilus ACht1 TaxID=1313304 RepID=U7D8Q6_9BACT|nr:aconitate hydratase [Chitinivibrio alkaliphilus]ERP39310.1 aconitate hydratase [Chitinivibrio alkaliphilus ACht1]
MGQNVVQKIIDAHIVEGVPQAGTEVGITIDQTLTQDATGTMAYLQFEAMGFDRVQTEVSVSYVDHNTIQEGFENADDHAYLQSIAKKYGIYYSKPGNGICHQVHVERFGVPGKTLLGSDSHTPTGGGIGMIAIGAGGLDVAVAMGGGAFRLTYPRVVKVNLTGKLQPWVSAKDVILKVLEEVSTHGNVGTIIEYGGEGIANLSVPERATITNMGAETGATTSVFPSDEVTRLFLEAQERGSDWCEITADADAEYDRIIDLDLSTLEPMVACPHSPGNIKRVADIAGTPVDQVLVGSCTNGSLRDIYVTAEAVAGKHIAENISFGIAAGSKQVMEMTAKDGSLAKLIAGGGRVLETACGFCIGNSQAPRTDAVSFRTSNRNFYGRSGTNSADIYLVSPETAAAIALAGTVVDPREYFAQEEYPRFSLPEKFDIDDSMIVAPAEDGSSITVQRGPNIGNPPDKAPLDESLCGEATIVVGDKITTDHIMPAGSRLKYRSNIPKYSEFVFERNDPDFFKKCMKNKKAGVDNVIIAGDSYGQGSSREHAAICPMYLGVKLVVARSMERIHKANLINFGIVPAVFENPADYDTISQGNTLSVEHIRDAVESGSERVSMKVGDREIVLKLELTDMDRKLLRAGGKINAVREGILS